MTEEDSRYLVMRNGEGQYSIWPADKPLALGWTAIGAPRSKADCLSYIEDHWVDLRPLSLRLPDPP